MIGGDRAGKAAAAFTAKRGNRAADRDRTLAAATSAYEQRDWATARAAFADLVESEPTPSGQLLEHFSVALKYTGAYDEAAQAMERAYRAFVAEADELGAVRCTTGMAGFRMMSDDRAGARAWERRGWRHLENVGACVERGYHAVAYVGCDIHDPTALLEKAELALSVAQEFNDHELELRALGDQGLALVCLGRVDDGFAVLDEVMVGITAGEISDAQIRGVTLCALVSACERTGDHGRAEAWGRAIEQDPKLQEMGIQVTHCEIAYGAVEAMRGRFDTAEARLLQAMAAQATTSYHSGSSRGKLAEVRIQQGRYEEAAALLKGYEDSFEAVPAMASLSVARGDFQRAAALLRAYTRGLGADLMRLGPALALLVELELKRHDPAAADKAARRLLGLEEACSSNEIRAMARLAAARIAIHKADTQTAIEELETALTLLVHRDRPLLTAEVRLDLARALAAAGDKAGAMVEAEAALATFRRASAAPGVAAAEAIVGGLAEVDAPNARGAAGRVPRLSRGSLDSLTRREAEIADLVAAGLTNREVAERLFLSVRTVETHVDRVLGKLDFHTRTQLAAWIGQGRPARFA